MSSAAPVVSPIIAFYTTCCKAKSQDKNAAAKFTLSKKTRGKLAQLLQVYNVDLVTKFGVADFEEGKSKLGKKEVEALEHISAGFMAIADFVMQLSKSEEDDDSDDFDALMAAGIPQLIGYQLTQGSLCHNKVAKKISEMMGYLGKR